MPHTLRPSTHFMLLNETTLFSYDWSWPWTDLFLKTILAPALEHSVALSDPEALSRQESARQPALPTPPGRRAR